MRSLVLGRSRVGPLWAEMPQTRGGLPTHRRRRKLEWRVLAKIRDVWGRWRESSRQYKIDRALYKAGADRFSAKPKTGGAGVGDKDIPPEGSARQQP